MAEEPQKDDFKPLQPSIPFQIVSLLEDAGLVNIANAGWTFEEAMYGPSFIIPDNVLWVVVFACVGYAAVLMHWI